MPVLPSRFAIDQVWEQKEERGKGAVQACMLEDGCVFARNEVYRLGGWAEQGQVREHAEAVQGIPRQGIRTPACPTARPPCALPAAVE